MRIVLQVCIVQMFQMLRASLLFDVKNRRWSRQMLDICGVTEAQMPRIFESSECVGTVKKNIADELGIGSEVIVATGAGDNATLCSRHWYCR